MDVNAIPVIQAPLFLTTDTTTSLTIIFVTAALLLIVAGYFYKKLKIVYKLYKTLKELKNKNITTHEAAYTYTDIINTNIPSNRTSRTESDNDILNSIKYSNEQLENTSELSSIIFKTMKSVLFGKKK